MWIVTNFGFFSIVEKPDDRAARMLTVRARVRADLERLRARYLQSMGDILEQAGSDYPYRARVARSDFAIALLRAALDIDYANFKGSVYEQQGGAREEIYHDVWRALLGLEAKLGASSANAGRLADEPAPTVPPARARASKAPASVRHRSYGGVLVDEGDRVLLRKPKGEYDGYVWTFGKGRPAPGATAEATALREVREETGYEGRIVCAIPGRYKGSSGDNEYYLMRPVGTPGPFDPKETEAVEWVPLDEAPSWIRKTRNPGGCKRDLAVLAAAAKVHRACRGNG